MKKPGPKIYIETSVISYLTSRPSKDVVKAARQKITKLWWEHSRRRFECLISEFVLDEAKGGDKKAAELRIAALEGINLLQVKSEAKNLATLLIKRGPIPVKAAVDAAHIAVAAVHGVDFLLTWNFTHIANAEMRADIIRLVQNAGYACPVICTPDELMGELE